MVYINNLPKKKVNFIREGELHKPAQADFQIIELNGWTRILQINTYGKSTRENPGKQSQVLQFDLRTIAQLQLIAKDYDIVPYK